MHRNSTHFHRFILSLTLLCCGVATAQSITTLKDAVEQAVLQNPEVKLRFHNLEAAQNEHRVAQGAWLPRIDLEAATGSYNQTTPTIASGQTYTGDRANLQLRQTLFDGFATRNETRRLSYNEQTAYFELLSASNQTALETARAYLDVLRYRELVALAEANFSTHLEVHDRLGQKVKAGVGRRVDLEQAQGRLALAESNWITETSNLHDVSARYQRLVGDIPAKTLSAAKPMDEWMPASVEFLTPAVQKNPDFRAAVSGIRAFRADADVRRAAYSPTLELRARQSVETNQSGVNGNYRDSALELVLNYNLFRGGSDSARIRQYASKLNSAFDLRDKTCRDVWQTGLIAYNDSTRLVAQLKLLAQHELSTSKARQAYQQQFDIGQRSLLDLLDTENELYQARRSLAVADYDLQLAKARVLATSDSLLSALELKTLPADLPANDAGAENGDEEMVCNNQVMVAQTLNRTIEPRSPDPAVEPAKPIVAPIAAVSPPAVVDANAAACGQLPSIVTGWLKAWNDKDTPQYLSAYSDRFTPALGLSRSAWETLRKKRIGKQGGIQATITNLRPLKCDAQSAEMAFTQEYGSTDYRDQVDKTLHLERVKDTWKITRETVTRGRTF